jgi:hypothetical protein
MGQRKHGAQGWPKGYAVFRSCVSVSAALREGFGPKLTHASSACASITNSGSSVGSGRSVSCLLPTCLSLRCALGTQGSWREQMR